MMYSNKLPIEVGNWVAGIGSSTPIEMTKRYAEKAVLLATYEKMLVGRSEIKGYFDDFLDKENLKCKVVRNITQIGLYEQIASGIYVFSFVDKGSIQVVKARYSFVVKGGLVVNHHSSETPE